MSDYTEKYAVDEYSVDESQSTSRSSSLRQDHEFFCDEDYVPLNMINVKRVTLPSGDEDWEIYNDKTCVFILKGIRFNKKEKNFLRTPDGFRFIIDGYKSGYKSVSDFKKHIKKLA